MEAVLDQINAVIWGVPVLLLILMTGIYLTIKSRFAQIRLFPAALKHFICSLKTRNRSQDGTSGYRALCTALAATVGTGNIAGVAGAIALGGPGVIFWMWICAILGMVIKLAEVTLALTYRQVGASGEYIGGPMYIIKNGLPHRLHFLAGFYCFFGIVAALGVGNTTQVNAVAEGIRNLSGMLGSGFGKSEAVLLGTVIAVLVMVILRGGISGVGCATEMLVPFAAVLYIILAFIVLILRFTEIPNAFQMIMSSAFSPKAVTGGTISSILITMRVGIARGVFTNEAGMGTASIAHAASNTDRPFKQGLLGIMEVFLDTVLICTITGIVILVSGVKIPYGSDPGIALTLNAFSSVLGNWSELIITILTAILAFATVLGWSLYGARCSQFLFGEGAWKRFTYIQGIAAVLGCVLDTSVVWVISEIINALMAIPNLIAVYLLSGVFISIIKREDRKKAYRHF